MRSSTACGRGVFTVKQTVDMWCNQQCSLHCLLHSSSRGKKITCPGTRDKLNFSQEKHIFSTNVGWASKKIQWKFIFPWISGASELVHFVFMRVIDMTFIVRVWDSSLVSDSYFGQVMLQQDKLTFGCTCPGGTSENLKIFLPLSRHCKWFTLAPTSFITSEVLKAS